VTVEKFNPLLQLIFHNSNTGYNYRLISEIITTGTGDAQRKRQTTQQAAVCTILQCDARISHHHTAAALAATALTRSIHVAAAAVAVPVF